MHSETKTKLVGLIRKQVPDIVNQRVRLDNLKKEIEEQKEKLDRLQRNYDNLVIGEEKDFIALIELMRLEGTIPMYKHNQALEKYFQFFPDKDQKQASYAFMTDVAAKLEERNE